MDKQYNKSLGGEQCIGECYNAGQVIIHPITNKPITDPTYPFCPINNTYTKNKPSTYNINYALGYAECAKTASTVELVPFATITPTYILNIIYKLNSFDDIIKYFNNKPINKYTMLRIFDIGLELYYQNLKIIDFEFVKLLMYIFKSHYMDLLYNKLYKYIGVEENKDFTPILINPSKTKIKKNSNKKIRIKFLKKHILNKESLHKFTTIYFNNYITSEYFKSEILLNNYINYIINELNNKFKYN